MSRPTARILIVVVMGLILLAGASAGSGDSKQRRSKYAHGNRAKPKAQKGPGRKHHLTPAPVPQPDEDEFEDVEGREDWFLFQRRYPFDSIPADARREAWASRPAESKILTITPTWQSIGPRPTMSRFPNNWGLTSGRINSIAISPTNSQIILIAGATGGIWRSTDGGVSFSPTSDAQADLAVQSIVFSQSNSAIVYAGMGDRAGGYIGTGVLKSTDSGQTWVRINDSSLPSPGITSKIDVDPTNPNRVYLAQYAHKDLSGGFFSSGFYLSSDGGVTWTVTLPGLARDVAINSASSQTLYLAMTRVDDGVSLPGLYRSTNGGVNWNRIYTPPYSSTSDLRVAVSSANPQVLYVYTGGQLGSSFDTRVVTSTDGGANWTNLGSGTLNRGAFSYNTYIYVDPSNSNILYVGTPDLFKSVNGGVSWTNLTNDFDSTGAYHPGVSTSHPDQHSLAFMPGSSNTIFIGNDGGIWKSTNGGTTFSSLNASLGLTMFVGYTMHPTNGAISYGGTQDNGTQKRPATGGEWQEIISGDGGDCVVNPVSPSTVFTTYIYGTIFRFINDGAGFEAQVGTNSTFGEPDSSPRIAFYPPFTGNGVNGTLYFGTWRLFTSTNLGNNWTAPAGTLDLTKGFFDVLTAIGVSQSNTNIIYTGSGQGRAMVSTNGGATWADMTGALPNRFIKSITVDRTNSAIAYLTVSGFGSGHVFRTINTGATWTDVSGNLPNIPVNALLIDPISVTTIYAGTDIGVFRSTSSGNVWQGFNNGLPPAIVNAFGSQSNGTIQAATYGRGAYQLMSVATRTLTVASLNPSSGASITVSPNDAGGQGSGVTQFTRTYNDATVVTLTAPATSGSNPFQKWQRNGADYSASNIVMVTMDADYTMTAVFSSPPVFQGFLDAAGCGIITGWAWNALQPNTVINVDIYDGTTLITTIPANLFREDIVNAGIGNGFHGFSFTVPLSLKNGQLHNIRARFGGTSTELGNSPRPINCSGSAPSYQGFHDGAGCGTIAGWAWDLNDPNNPINVDIYDGAALIATVPAIQFRPDLVTAGIGNGFHGFSFTVPTSMKDGQPHSIRVRFPATATDLGNTPRTIACSGIPPAFQGFHDQATCSVISGWAWDSNDPNSPINVAIFSDGQLIATVLAIQFRQDLVNAGIGNGFHAFSFNVPASLKDGQPHSISARYSGTATSLGATPRTITCPP